MNLHQTGGEAHILQTRARSTPTSDLGSRLAALILIHFVISETTVTLLSYGHSHSQIERMICLFSLGTLGRGDETVSLVQLCLFHPRTLCQNSDVPLLLEFLLDVVQ